MAVHCELLSRLLHLKEARAALADLMSLRPEDWNDILDQAEHHQVVPLLHRALQSPEGRAVVPAGVRERLQISYFTAAARSARLVSELAAVLRAARTAGLAVVVLKGAHLAEVVYQDVTLRPMGDVDLLVRRADLPLAERVLLDLGYRPVEARRGGPDYSIHRHLAPFVKPGAVPIEVHWTLDESGCFRIEDEGLWERARGARIAGVETLVLGPEDLLQHLCLHAAFQHGFRVPLRQIYDIALGVRQAGPELDWRGLTATADASGLSRVCYYALALAESLLGAGIPAPALAALAAPGCDEKTVAVLRAYVLLDPSQRPPDGLREVLQGRSGRERMSALLRSVFPTPARLREIYGLPPGSPATYGYYPVRFWDLLIRRGLLLVRLGSSRSAARRALEMEAQGQLLRRQLEDRPHQPGEARGR